MERYEKDQPAMPHQLILQDRKQLEISGVVDVDSFDENVVICDTSLGRLTIHGRELHVNRLNVEGNALSVEGRIDSFVYTDAKRGGLFGRLLR